MANLKSLYGCKFLMLTVLAASSTVTGIITNSVCEGDSVQIFQNISSAKSTIKLTLYKIGAGKEEVIAIWFVNHSHIVDHIKDKYKPKVSFENGTIILRNIESTDEATYALVYNIDDLSDRKEAHISALVPPTNLCKPKIRQEENVLIALLDNQEYCGTPQVSIQWLEYPGIFYKDKAVIEVPSGKDACTYYACIEGEALTCTRKSALREYCEHIIIGSTKRESITIPSSDIQHLQTATIVIAAILSLILIVVIASPIIRWKYCRSGPRDPERALSDRQRIDRSSWQNRNVTDPDPGHGDPECENWPLQENIEMQVMQ